MRLTKFSGMTDYIVNQPSEAEIALHRAEAENADLRVTVRRLESALRAAARLLRPYADRAE
jgi:hypothetical protein